MRQIRPGAISGREPSKARQAAAPNQDGECSEQGLGGGHGGSLGDAELLVQDGCRGGGSVLVHSDGLALGARVPLPAKG